MNMQYPPMSESRSDSQHKKIRKVIRSPQKVVITGQTQNNIQTNKVIDKAQQVGSRSYPPNEAFRGTIFMVENMEVYYEGQIVNNTPQGQGNLCSLNGKVICSGSWRDGMRNGFGSYFYPDGSEYRGEWINNMKSGQGTYYCKGYKYEGQWLQNMKHGKGKLEFKEGITLNGLWQNDQFIQGQVFYADRSSYRGTMKNYSRNGVGTYTYPNQQSYGSYAYHNQQNYSGNWSNNMKNGQGQYNFSNGDRMTGSFKDNMKNGKINYTWKQDNYSKTDLTFADDKYIPRVFNNL